MDRMQGQHGLVGWGVGVTLVVHWPVLGPEEPLGGTHLTEQLASKGMRGEGRNLVVTSVSLAREGKERRTEQLWAEGRLWGRERREDGQRGWGSAVRVPVGPCGPTAPLGALLAPLRRS